ncbi:hypothetical protein LOAG_03740 [Loa loa]|uniref:FMRF-Like Peptide n=1 Tax=Loa loa TaxID=7209 RepID=A0A1I7VNB7_LOALO|nr:hypothetical protein LOAG_03740 [Loa loa]EFO24747.1 hypothetical protein LOAG_03740 [Loa loa]
METTGWMMHMVKLVIFIVTITATTTTTLYVQLDNSNAYRPLHDTYEPVGNELLIKRDYGDIPGVLRFGKRDYDPDPVYRNPLPNIMQFNENGYEKKDIPGVLRFGKREGDIPGVLRFGKRNDDIPGVLRFGKRSVPGVLRFGRR